MQVLRFRGLFKIISTIKPPFPLFTSWSSPNNWETRWNDDR